MEKQETYQVNVEAFQGPMDLLLFLIRKKKIDIHDIPIAAITGEYLKYLEEKDRINLEREGDFLLIAALLIYIKSQMLLPRETLEGEEDPRQMLVDRILEFQKIKAASSLLRNREEESLKRWKRNAPPALEGEEKELGPAEITLFDLAEMFFRLMQQLEREEVKVISVKEFSLEEKMNEILDILKKDGFLDFMNYFGSQESFEEALGAFFCLLELVRRKVAVAVQEGLFSTIKVWPGKESAA